MLSNNIHVSHQRPICQHLDLKLSELWTLKTTFCCLDAMQPELEPVVQCLKSPSPSTPTALGCPRERRLQRKTRSPVRSHLHFETSLSRQGGCHGRLQRSEAFLKILKETILAFFIFLQSSKGLKQTVQVVRGAPCLVGTQGACFGVVETFGLSQWINGFFLCFQLGI